MPMKMKTTAAPPMEIPAIAPGLNFDEEDAGAVEVATGVPAIIVVCVWEEVVVDEEDVVEEEEGDEVAVEV